MPMPVYLQFIFSSAGVCVAVCAVVVSAVQLHLARKKLEMEKFPTRVRVFEAIMGLYSRLLRN